MLLSRLGTSLLLLLSGASFVLVYALNVDEKHGGAIYRFMNPIVQNVMNDKDVSEDITAPILPDISAPRRPVFTAEEERDGMIRRTLVVGKGETLTSRLLAAGVTRTEVVTALDAMRSFVNPRKIATGQKVVLVFKKNDKGEVFNGFEVRKEATQLISVARTDDDSFKGQLREVVPEKHRFALRGAVQDGLYESGLRSGIPAPVLTTMIRTYSYLVDFQREVKQGDRFEVLFEETTDDEGHSVGDPTLIYAALSVGEKILPVYRVAMPGGSFEYYDAGGHSIRKGLLRTPVEGAHLTSTFGMRLHPLLGFSRMHKGVDFGAPYGAPIYAAGAGIVEESGTHSGYGNYVRLRHNGHLSTAYAHLSRFGRGITRGSRVAQGDIIGYVGSSGMSTGPHLHYEVLVDAQQVNPLNVKVTTNAPLEGKQLVAFQTWRARVHGAFEQLVADAETGHGLRVAHNQASAVTQ